jgi:hypothetical protein
VSFKYNKSSVKKTRKSNLPITAGSTLSYARVIKTILREDDEYYDQLGRSQSLYGILYRKIGVKDNEENEGRKNFAAPLLSNFRKPPLPGELVLILSGPGVRGNPSILDTAYYLDIVGVWNHPHFNILPDVTQKSSYFDGEDITIEGNFEDIGEKVNPLQLFQGDISIEGRSGNSIRFGGTTNTNNTNVVSNDKMSPYIVIRNGQIQKESGVEPVLEDINTNDASIYLTSNHKVPIRQSVRLRNTYLKGDQIPPSPESYIGNQILISSGRLIFDAKKDLLLLSSLTDIELNSNKIHIEAKTYSAIDAPKIYLGSGASTESEPILKGATTVEWLNDLVVQLKESFKNISESGPDARPFIAATIKEMSVLSEVLEPFIKQLEDLPSNKTFVE